MKIAVVEDEKVHADILIRLLETWLKENKVDFSIREFPDAAAFLFEWEQDQAWNVLFFDIKMPGLNGISRKVMRLFVSPSTSSRAWVSIASRFSRSR